MERCRRIRSLAAGLENPDKMKTPCKTEKFPGFTLIELLVVIGIIATLSAVAMPAIQNALMAGKITRATNDARQIVTTLRLYSQDHEGAFPDGQEINSANDAFRQLFPDYTQVESIFAEPPSA